MKNKKQTSETKEELNNSIVKDVSVVLDCEDESADFYDPETNERFTQKDREEGLKTEVG